MVAVLPSVRPRIRNDCADSVAFNGVGSTCGDNRGGRIAGDHGGRAGHGLG